MKSSNLLGLLAITCLLGACSGLTEQQFEKRISQLKAPEPITFSTSSDRGSESRSVQAVRNNTSNSRQLQKTRLSGDAVYRDSAPQRYVVKPGDTLWGIAKRFLKSPAYWRNIWHANSKIKNPNVIYPGDVISYVLKNGQKKLQISGSSNSKRDKFTGKRARNGLPIYKITPSVVEETLSQPIPVLPKEVINQLVSKSLVVDTNFFSDAPYILQQPSEQNISLTLADDYYAQGDFNAEIYDVYRYGKQLVSPSGEYIGELAEYRGTLILDEVLENGIAKLSRLDDFYVIKAGDVLAPRVTNDYGSSLNYTPRLSDLEDDAVIVKSIDTESDHANQFNTVLVDKGILDGIKEGDVLNVVKKKEQYARGRNGEAIKLPDLVIGYGMVYKVFESSSYVIITEAERIISVGDRLVSP